MFTIERLIHFSKFTKKPFLNFPLIFQRKRFLLRAIRLKSEELNSPKWTPKMASEIFKDLKKQKYSLYDELIEKHGEEAINSLIP